MSSTDHIIARPSTIRQALRRTASSMGWLPELARCYARMYDSYPSALADLVRKEEIIMERLIVALQVSEDLERERELYEPR